VFRKIHDTATTVRKLARQTQTKVADKAIASKVTQARNPPITRAINNAQSSNAPESSAISSPLTVSYDLSGGLVGQVLTKNSDAFFDFTWTSIGGGLPGLTWSDLVNGFKTTPTLLTTTVDGDVYEYIFEGSGGDVTLYRLVPSGAEDDAFYTSFVDPVLSGLVVTKKVLL